MGGSSDDFSDQFKEHPGIICDEQGNILELRWWNKELNGNLSSKLGKLPRLQYLYDFIYDALIIIGI